jgi:predicted transglutaminase-like cysteine proteinase
MFGSRPARVALAIAVGVFSFVMSCRGIAEEAPLQVASLAAPAMPALPQTALPLRGDEPFGLTGAVKPGAALAARWRDAEEAIRADLAAIDKCRADNSCTGTAKALIAMADEARALSGRARIGAANRAANLAIAPVTDLSLHGTVDVWSSPLELLAARKGDCEDYAILKIAILRAAGIDARDLRLVVVRDQATNEGHAIASVRLDGRWLLLDNRRMTLMDAADSLYRPFFALSLRDEPRTIEWAQAPSGSGAMPVLM